MFKRFISLLICTAFTLSNIQNCQAQDFSLNQLPVPGAMINVTPAYVPLTLKGMLIHPDNALKFDFLMDTGYSHLKGKDLSDEALKIMKYFLTALTIPEDDLWVNLSPYEKGRIVQDNFGKTVMGRDLLAEDYVLKQLTASLIYPEKSLGKEFWSQVYSKAAKEYGTTQIPVDTFNKVWIVPSEAAVWEHDNKVMIVKSHLKVMLEEDYLSLQKHVSVRNGTNTIGENVIRQIVLPVLEKEINEGGENFAQLRQMYQAMILATWYKKALRESIINKVYADKQKVAGIRYKKISNQVNDVELIYQQYIKAFKKGAFNYIQNEVDPITGKVMPRKYFSGGFSLSGQAMISRFKKGITSFALALIVLTGASPAAIGKPVGQMILVHSQVKEVEQDLKPQATDNSILVDDMTNVILNSVNDTSFNLDRSLRKINKEDRAMVAGILIGIAASFLGMKWLGKKDEFTLDLMDGFKYTVSSGGIWLVAYFMVCSFSPRFTNDMYFVIPGFIFGHLLPIPVLNIEIFLINLKELKKAEKSRQFPRYNLISKRLHAGYRYVNKGTDEEPDWQKVKLTFLERFKKESKKSPLRAKRDAASIAQSSDDLGGIALNSKLMDFQIKRDGHGVPLPISQQPLDKIKIFGFSPQVDSIQYVNFSEFLAS